MRCFYAPETEGHDPSFRITHGCVVQNAERPERARLLQKGLAEVRLTTEEPGTYPRSALERVHTPRFLNYLETCWDEWQALPDAGPEVIGNAFPRNAAARYPTGLVARAGWHAADVSAPIGPHSWTATRRSADCALAAADAVLGGARTAYALCRPPGHHTSAEVAGGHCLLNVSAIAAAHLRETHERVAILDIDTHHGNGTQDIFWERGDVFFASVHTDPSDYYPFFTGFADETGAGDGVGATLNLPLPRTTGGISWCASIHDALERIIAFDPGALVVSLGLDAHTDDPLKGMRVDDSGFTRAGALIADAGLPTVFVQEGGYLSDSLPSALSSFMDGVCSMVRSG
ncbi:histone deacetylase family protein [Roseivivax marinus]|uniref:histone deacetylase family protein n=1 Tax=Roseivivax marinus TaxID=1379903 RepID=UPI001F04A56D|nr:histone deacetylase family protein [Roseivivax marinus]UMA64687.1 histone deacetylase family protein [Roseivivax marinus]